MKIVSNLMLLWKNRKALKAVSDATNQVRGGYMKSGIRSTEFWIVVLTSASTLLEAFKGTLDPKWSAVITGAIAVGYSLTRAITKAAASVSQAPVVAPETVTAPAVDAPKA